MQTTPTRHLINASRRNALSHRARVLRRESAELRAMLDRRDTTNGADIEKRLSEIHRELNRLKNRR